MKTFFSLLLIISTTIACKTKETATCIIKEDPVTTPVFPDDWMGYWEGEMKIYAQGQLKQTLNMAVDHALTDNAGVYTWAIIYGDPTEGRRSYDLITIDAESGHYAVDENNGLILDSYLFDNKMISQFEVMGNLLQSIYTHNGDHILFEIFSGSGTPIRETITTDADSIKVLSYDTQVMQRAILRKRPVGNHK